MSGSLPTRGALRLPYVLHPVPLTPCRDRSGYMRLSVVVPCYNEEEVIQETHRRLVATLGSLPQVQLELVYVNDGSRDRTAELLGALARADERVHVLHLARNFGQPMATTAGLDYARGDAVVVIDADLQDPPEVVVEFLRAWREGSDIVYGRRRERQGETWFKLFTAKVFYRLLARLSDVAIPIDTGDFRLLDRQVVEALKAFPERDRYLRGMIAWTGFRQTLVDYKRDPRLAGVTKYSLRKLVRTAMDAFVSFSSLPLRLATALGFFSIGVALLGVLYTVVVRLFTDAWVSGWAFIVITILTFSGVQLFCLGVIGEYLGRLYEQAKNRPLYIVASIEGGPPPGPRPTDLNS